MPLTPQPSSKSEFSTHHLKRCRAARFKIQLGQILIGLGMLSVVFASIIMFNAPKAPVRVNQTAYEAGRAAGIRARQLIRGPVTFTLVFWALGAFSCLWGSLLKKTLDKEFNGSAILSQTEKRDLQEVAKTKGTVTSRS